MSSATRRGRRRGSLVTSMAAALMLLASPMVLATPVVAASPMSLTASGTATVVADLAPGVADLAPGVADADPVRAPADLAPAPVAPSPVVTPAPRSSGPHVQGEHTVRAYSYANAIRESVRVPTSLDSNQDGVNDTVVVDLIRPREAADAGVKVPVIAVVSPYFTRIGRGPEEQFKKYDAAGNLSMMPSFYDNYFVEHGYAVAAIDVIGTARSTGCPDVGGPMDVGGMAAALAWLRGTTTATYLAGGTGSAQATWSTGQYGLIGKSYDATLANAAAARGLDGLKTTVVLSGISSWYDYTRLNGLVSLPRYMGNLGGAVTNDERGCQRFMDQLDAAQEDRTGNYNDFFAIRDYVPDAANVKASVFAFHGHNDLNVTAQNTGKWLAAVQARGVPTKVWMSQAAHTDPFDIRRSEWIRQLHGWFDYWLQGVDSPVLREPRLDVETTVGQWTTFPSYPLAPVVTLPLSSGGIGAAGTGTVTVKNSSFRGEDAMVALPASKAKAVFVSAPLTAPFRFGGSGSVTLRVRTSQPSQPIVAKLVDYGAGSQRFTSITRVPGEKDCPGGSTPTDSACYGRQREVSRETSALVIGRGWMSSRHRDSLRTPTDMPAGTWVDLTIPLMMNVAVVPQGHQLGLVIGGNDGAAQTSTAATFEIDVAGSSLRLPTADAALIRPGTLPRRGSEVPPLLEFPRGEMYP